MESGSNDSIDLERLMKGFQARLDSMGGSVVGTSGEIKRLKKGISLIFSSWHMFTFCGKIFKSKMSVIIIWRRGRRWKSRSTWMRSTTQIGKVKI